MVLQAGRLDQAPIIHQVTSGLILMRADTRLCDKECRCFFSSGFFKTCSLTLCAIMVHLVYLECKETDINSLTQPCAQRRIRPYEDIKPHENYGIIGNYVTYSFLF